MKKGRRSQVEAGHATEIEDYRCALRISSHAATGSGESLGASPSGPRNGGASICSRRPSSETGGSDDDGASDDGASDGGADGNAPA
jgi:hypothetical protein